MQKFAHFLDFTIKMKTAVEIEVLLVPVSLSRRQVIGPEATQNRSGTCSHGVGQRDERLSALSSVAFIS